MGMIDYNKVEFETSFGLVLQLYESDCPEVVFAGRSNVGKSSLINKLFNRKKLARVSSTPGKTATINFFKAGAARFVDLPGYGYAAVSKGEKAKWGDLISGYFANKREIALVLLLLDIRHKPSKEDQICLKMLQELNLPFGLVFTKADKIPKSKVAAQVEFVKGFLNGAPEFGTVIFSAQSGQGIDALKELIDKALEQKEAL